MVWRTVARHLMLPHAAPRTADPAIAASLRQRLAAASARKLGRSLAIRHVPAGSCQRAGKACLEHCHS